MSSTFPKTKKRGYHVEEVEDFLEEARRAYTADIAAPVVINSGVIRRTAFTLKRGGYSPSHVDAALERLEDAFALRERERQLLQGGDVQWRAQNRSLAQEILDRVARPAKHRFDRAGLFVSGYRRNEVDDFTGRVRELIQHGTPLSVEEVRAVTFGTASGGYHEEQVDQLLDAVVELLLAAR